MANTSEELRGLILSANELKALTDWNDAVIEDYLNIFENFVLLSTTIDDESNDLSDVNQQVEALYGSVSKLKAMIGAIEIDNAQIAQNVIDIAENTASIINIDNLVNIYPGLINKNKSKINNILNIIQDILQSQSVISLAPSKNRANINRQQNKINDIEQLLYV